MKIMLCNDTATKAHIGCRAVSDAHARMLGQLGHTVAKRFFVNEIRTDDITRFDEIVAIVERHEPFMAALETVDAVVVNGEGTIHHGSGLALLAALHLAKRRGKATLLVNCLLQDIPIDSELIDAFDYLSVREVNSYDYARSRGVRCIMAFDSIVAARFAAAPSDLGNKIVVTDWTKRNDSSIGETSMRLATSADLGSSTELFEVHGARASLDVWPEAVSALAAARAVVSSRHHGLYLACLAQAPFISLRAHTWKGEGLLRSLGGDLPSVDGYSELREALETIDDRRPAYAAAFQKLQDARGLQHFDILGKGDDSTEDGEVARLRRDVEARRDLCAVDEQNLRNRRKQPLKWRKRLRPSLIRRIFG